MQQDLDDAAKMIRDRATHVETYYHAERLVRADAKAAFGHDGFACALVAAYKDNATARARVLEMVALDRDAFAGAENSAERGPILEEVHAGFRGKIAYEIDQTLQCAAKKRAETEPALKSEYAELKLKLLDNVHRAGEQMRCVLDKALSHFTVDVEFMPTLAAAEGVDSEFTYASEKDHLLEHTVAMDREMNRKLAGVLDDFYKTLRAEMECIMKCFMKNTKVRAGAHAKKLMEARLAYEDVSHEAAMKAAKDGAEAYAKKRARQENEEVAHETEGKRARVE